MDLSSSAQYVNRLWTAQTARSVLIPILLWLILILLRRQKEEESETSLLSKTTTNNDQYKIAKCPNPNCIRCRRYEQVNIIAKQSLSWVVSSLKGIQPSDNTSSSSNTKNINHNDTIEEQLKRIIHAVRVGPTLATNEQKTNANIMTAPIIGQDPTVLLVRGLSAQPIVTHLHSQMINAKLSDNDIRQDILYEYFASQQQHQQQRLTQKKNDIIDSGSRRSSSSSSSSNTLPQSYNHQWLRNDVNDTGSWEVLHLLNQGEWNEENKCCCPKTTKIIQSLSPNLLEGCIFGNAFISVLLPGTIIDPHCGPSNVRHRLHFPLKLPSTQSRYNESNSNNDNNVTLIPTLTVGGIVQTWNIDELFCFDDSITHSVSYPSSINDTTTNSKRYIQKQRKPVAATASNINNKARVVLIVDLWHPELTQLERSAITKLYASRVR